MTEIQSAVGLLTETPSGRGRVNQSADTRDVKGRESEEQADPESIKEAGRENIGIADIAVGRRIDIGIQGVIVVRGMRDREKSENVLERSLGKKDPEKRNQEKRRETRQEKVQPTLSACVRVLKTRETRYAVTPGPKLLTTGSELKLNLNPVFLALENDDDEMTRATEETHDAVQEIEEMCVKIHETETEETHVEIHEIETEETHIARLVRVSFLGIPN
jgi:hypothetical protein